MTEYDAISGVSTLASLAFCCTFSRTLPLVERVKEWFSMLHLFVEIDAGLVLLQWC